MPGFALLFVYLAVPPFILARTVLKDVYAKLGPARYGILMVLFLVMLSLPIKMYLRWFFNLKYIVAIPEFFFNI